MSAVWIHSCNWFSWCLNVLRQFSFLEDMAWNDLPCLSFPYLEIYISILHVMYVLQHGLTENQIMYLLFWSEVMVITTNLSEMFFILWTMIHHCSKVMGTVWKCCNVVLRYSTSIKFCLLHDKMFCNYCQNIISIWYSIIPRLTPKVINVSNKGMATQTKIWQCYHGIQHDKFTWAFFLLQIIDF